MKAIGGYFELECGTRPLYYKDGIYLNICRSALRYLIRALKIKKIYVPIYTCNVVHDAILQEKCKIELYSLNDDFLPNKDFPKYDFILYNNYFGVLGNNVRALSNIYPNLIVDNAQAFYSQPPCRAAIYSPRKFFGLPDGGILRGKDIPNLNLEEGHSSNVCSHLLKRIDYGAQAAYKDFTDNDRALENYSLQSMSNLTKSLMGNIDYEHAALTRKKNFETLHHNLKSIFPFAFATDDVPMVYPLMLKNGIEVRNKLISNNIFVARYWPNVLDSCTEKNLEYQFVNQILPLPIDQRYDENDMKRIIRIINETLIS